MCGCPILQVGSFKSGNPASRVYLLTGDCRSVLLLSYSIRAITGVNTSLLTDDDCHVLSVDRTILFAVIELGQLKGAI